MVGAILHDHLPGLERDEGDDTLRCGKDKSKAAKAFQTERPCDDRKIAEAEDSGAAASGEQPAEIAKQWS